MVTRLRPKNQVTVPSSLTSELGWSQGDRLRLWRDRDRIVIEREPLAMSQASGSPDEAFEEFTPLEMADGWTGADLLAADREGLA